MGESHLHTVSSPGSIFLLNTVSQSINSNPHGKRSFGPDHHGSGTMRHNRPNRTTIARATNFLSHTTRHCGRNSVSQSHNVQIIIITPGQCAMADQIDSPLPGRVTQQKINYRQCYKCATILVEQGSNPCFTQTTHTKMCSSHM